MINKFLFQTITPGWFRLFLALIVVVFHSVSFLTIGHYAVFVFFILSGYWIFKMYKEKYSLYKNSYLVYLRSRLFRIMPVYWVILLLTLMLYAIVPDLLNQAQTSAPNIFTSVFFNFLLIDVTRQSFLFIVPAWSLCLEIQFYILAPLLILIYTNKNAAILVTIFFYILSIVLVYKSWPFSGFFKIFIYLPFFLTGGLIFIFDIQYSERSAKIGILAIFLILVFNYLTPQIRNNFLLNKNALIFNFNYSELLNVIFAVLTIPFVTNNIRQKVIQHKNENILSSMSYVIYLLHWPLLLIYSMSVKNMSALQKLSHLLVFYFSCIFLSWLISIFIDNFFERKRKKWIKTKRLINLKPVILAEKV